MIPDPNAMPVDPATGQPMLPAPGDTTGGLMGNLKHLRLMRKSLNTQW